MKFPNSNKTVYARQYESNAKATTVASDSLKYTYIDKAGPTISSATANDDKTITVKATDNGGSGIAGYKLTTVNTKPGASESGWSTSKNGEWKSSVQSPGTYYAWAKDALDNVSSASKSAEIKLPGAPDKDGYFTENSTVDGGPASSQNPTIPEGFKPYEEPDTTKPGNTGTAHWTDNNGKPSKESVRQGLVIESKDLGEFVWIPVPSINKMVRCETNKYGNDDCNFSTVNNKIYCTTHSNYNIYGLLYLCRDRC